MLGMFPYPPEVTRGSYDSAKYENVFKMKFPSTSEVNGGYYGDGGKRWIISNNKFPYPPEEIGRAHV